MRNNALADVIGDDLRRAYAQREASTPETPVSAEYIERRLTRMAQLYVPFADEDRYAKLQAQFHSAWEWFVFDVMDRAANGMPALSIADILGCSSNYPGFQRAYSLGRLLWQQTALIAITKRMEAGDTAGIKTVLEAIDSDTWAPRKRMEVSHTLDPRTLSVEQLQEMVKQLEDLSAKR